MGSGDMGFPIVQHWTSQGYVVLCPTHADSIKLQRGAGRDAAAGLAAAAFSAVRWAKATRRAVRKT